MKKINLEEKFSLFNDHWNPRIVGELNNQQVKLAKLKGEFIWHKHENEDELFLVIDGVLTIEFRDKIVELKENEFIIVPKGVEHRRIAEKEVTVLFFEPKTTINTGDLENELTKKKLNKI